MQSTEIQDPMGELERRVHKMDAEERAARALSHARIKLVLGKDAKSCFFASLALRLKPEVNWEFPTLGTDGKRLVYNPDFFLALSGEERVGCVAHEVLHNALCHPARRGYRDKKGYNIAADLSVNPLLREAGFTLPAGAVFPGKGEYKDFPGDLSMEEYYALLQKDEPPGDPDPDGEEGGGQGEGEGSCPDPGGCGGVMDPGDGSPAAVREAQAEMEVAVAQAHQASKSRGNLSGGLARLVAELLAPKVDWREVLREFVSRQAKNDFSWTPPNRRFVWQGLYLPGLRSEELGNVIVAVDTSGSIGEKEIQVFGSEIQGILEAFQDVSLTIVYCDSRIQHVQKWCASDGALVMEPKGGGGTSHIPVFEWIDQQDEPPTCVVCLTDLYTTTPDSPPSYPVLWASTSPGMTGPFGATVEVTL